MASTNPVPSRAAINALRGVILTTSCSVILLAEERRRRIKIARAAIDNARKLHTVRVNHGPALSENFGRREAWPAELDDPPPMPIVPQSRGLVRRRRRDGHASLSTDPAKSIEPKALSKEPRSAISTPQTIQQEWDEWEATRRELSRVSGPSPFAHHDLFLRMAADQHARLLLKEEILQMKESDTEIADETPMQRQKQWDELETAPKEALGVPEPAPVSRQSKVLKIPTDYQESMPALTISEVSRTNEVESKLAEVPQTKGSEMETISTEDKAGPLEAKQLREAMAELDDLLSKLEASSPGQADASQQLSSATELFKVLVSAQFISPQMAIEDGLKLLKSSVNHEKYYNIHTVLKATLPACGDSLILIEPFVNFLERKRDSKGMRQLLLHHNLTQKSIGPDQSHESWMSSLLAYKWRSTRQFAAVQEFYQLLQDAGLFAKSRLTPLAQYTIRRRVALIALDARDGAVARAELEQMEQLKPGAIKTDAPLVGKSIIYEATEGRWDSVPSDLATLKDIPGSNQVHYQRVLSKLTRMYAKSHSPEQVDIFVQTLVEECGMELNQTLAFVVADRHGRNRDTASLTQWLRYCQESGLEFDQPFFNKLSHKCWKYWSFDRKDVLDLFRGLRAFFPWLQEPQLSKYSHTGALDGLLKEHSDETASMQSLRQLVGLSIGSLEQNAFKCMNSQALKGDWEEVKKAYNEAAVMGLGFSPRCLRLAVVANIKKEGCHSHAAMNLIRQAHAEGHDVSSALVPLLVAQLESGDNAEALIGATLKQGVRIHDSVYNKAARSLTQKGQHEAAITMCKIAARENGNGDPAYNKFNFATLLVACTRLEWYCDVALLIERFTSRFLFWHGSKECKESIKLTMKMVARRAEARPGELERHSDMLLTLDKALQHVKESRSTIKDDRKMLAEGLVDALNPLSIVNATEGVARTEDGRLASTEPSSAVQVTTETETVKQLDDAPIEEVRQSEGEAGIQVKDKPTNADYDVMERVLQSKRSREEGREVTSRKYSTADSIQFAW